MATVSAMSSATVEAKAAQAARQAQKRGQQELEAEQEAEARADRVLAHKAFPRMDPSMDGTQQIWDQKIRRIAVRLEISRRKARRIVKCQACDEQMEFCSHPRCLQVLQGSCPCGECDGHPHEDLPIDMFEPDGAWDACSSCADAFCKRHAASFPHCRHGCTTEPACSSCTDVQKCAACRKTYCDECISSGITCRCWVEDEEEGSDEEGDWSDVDDSDNDEDEDEEGDEDDDY